MKEIATYWARGMALLGALVAFITFWNLVLVPLFYNYAAVRILAVFLIVSVVAIIFGGIMTHGARHGPEDSYGDDR